MCELHAVSTDDAPDMFTDTAAVSASGPTGGIDDSVLNDSGVFSVTEARPVLTSGLF